MQLLCYRDSAGRTASSDPGRCTQHRAHPRLVGMRPVCCNSHATLRIPRRKLSSNMLQPASLTAPRYKASTTAWLRLHGCMPRMGPGLPLQPGRCNHLALESKPCGHTIEAGKQRPGEPPLPYRRSGSTTWHSEGAPGLSTGR